MRTHMHHYARLQHLVSAIYIINALHTLFLTIL